ncbi:MAG: DUF3788 family protein [Ignavibacteriaceae bacterium]
MEQPILSDKNRFPAEDIIFSHIGRTKTLWISFFEYIHSDHPDFSQEWRFYNDGKSWLMKVQRKAKTIFWLSIIKNSFRITFYFTDKSSQAIAESNISGELKAQFRDGKSYGKIKGITIIFKKKKDVEYAKSLIAVKLSLK